MPLVDTLFRSRRISPLVFGVVAVLVAFALSALLPTYLVYLAITAIVATIALLGLGIVTGTAGMIALCQLTFAAVGAWIVSLFTVLDVPGGYILWLVAGGVVAGLAGVVIGLPALRLRGVNLAVVTLGFAAAADATLLKTQFPGAPQGTKVPRPEGFLDDRGFFFFCAIVLVVIAVAVHYLQRSRFGSGWRSVAFSERGTASAGTSVRLAKLSAFAVSAAIAGIAGGLIAGQVGTAYPAGFSTIQSLALYVLAIVSGAYLIEMAVFGGILWVLIPELLKRFGIPQDWGFVVFGALGIQALTTNSNLGQDLRNALTKRRHRRGAGTSTGLVPLSDEAFEASLQASGSGSGSGKPLLTVTGLSVSFGQVKALQNVDLTVDEGAIVGLIGPNGAGKSTFVDAVAGFLPQHEGTVRLGGDALDGLPPHKRARLGLRRTFQQDRVPPSLTVGDYVAFIARGEAEPVAIAEVLAFIGCPPASTRIVNVDVGTRRLVEVAANLAAKPRLLVLDEPAAGLSHEEHVAFGQRLRMIPARYGTSILIIEHDLDLVRSVCSSITVLNFGAVLASGSQETVMNDPEVLKAYMGETEML
ncbi:ATP-binding cassette domain-containing protein [Herbiconiux sp.]|uniref:branched-chain amino acid ABC transporter ATP-binding protein/permease n=1 Tax=Herbiconiux sp. TaxID=1871186 RepID=UPI0025C643C9|nr:ATP-binding cassette domain-containing protein [Herbiconiux sp.]